MRTIIITESERTPAREVLEAADSIIGKKGTVVLKNANNSIVQYPDNFYFKNIIYAEKVGRNEIIRQLS